ncbi:MAG: helix-turn-helix domain-containing protein [bacterium]
MSQIGEIRRMYAVEGWGIKTIARRLGVSRNTVRRVLRVELRCEPPPPRKNQPRPKMGAFVEVLEGMLEEDEKLPASRRRSPQQLYEQLQGLGYTGAIDSVRRYAKR